jgi:hypothetical protein
MDIVKTDIAIFRATHPEFGYQWIDGRSLAFILNRPYRCRLYTRLRELHEAGYLDRDKPNTKQSKYSAWGRTGKADEYMLEHFGEPLPSRTKSPFAHQILDDLDTFSLELGVKAHPQVSMRRCKSLGTIDLGDNIRFEFDGRCMPQELATDDEHMFIFKEIDRYTEHGPKILSKIRCIKEFQSRKHDFGIDHFFVRYLTVHPAQSQFILKKIREVIGERCWYIGVAEWKDWGNHDLGRNGQLNYPEPSGYTFDVPYQRVGFAPMELRRFWEC